MARFYKRDRLGRFSRTGAAKGKAKTKRKVVSKRTTTAVARRRRQQRYAAVGQAVTIGALAGLAAYGNHLENKRLTGSKVPAARLHPAGQVVSLQGMRVGNKASVYAIRNHKDKPLSTLKKYQTRRQFNKIVKGF